MTNKIPDKIKSCPCCNRRQLNFYMRSSFPETGMIQQQMVECLQCGCHAPLGSWQSNRLQEQMLKVDMDAIEKELMSKTTFQTRACYMLFDKIKECVAKQGEN